MTSLISGILNNVEDKRWAMAPALPTIASSIGMPDDVKLARANLAAGGGWDDQQ